jgi:hypothetical protein
MPEPWDVLEYAGGAHLAGHGRTTVGVAAPDDVLLFSNGDISRTQAMRRLGIGYSELLDRTAVRKLPLPRVGNAEAERMADTLVALLEAGAR